MWQVFYNIIFKENLKFSLFKIQNWSTVNPMELYCSVLTIWNTLPFMDVSVFTEVQLQLLPLKFTAMLCFYELIFSGKFSYLTWSCRLTILISPKRNTSSAFQNTNTGCIYVSLKKRGNVSCIMNSHKITKLLIHVFYYFGAGILDYTSTGGIP